MDTKGTESVSILIAIGNRSRALLWAIHAENCGYSCQLAASAGETLELLGFESFRLLMIGDDFPDGRGRLLVEEARKLTPRPRIFAVLIADSQKEHRAFDPATVDETCLTSTPVGHLERLWNIWLASPPPPSPGSP